MAETSVEMATQDSLPVIKVVGDGKLPRYNSCFDDLIRERQSAGVPKNKSFLKP